MGSQIFQEIGKICRLKKELEKLGKTVSEIHSRQVKDWLERLEGVVKEVGELVNEFNDKASKQRQKGNKVIKEMAYFLFKFKPSCSSF